jgi:glycosyltransferase involved in cell wall biosynthesis
MKILIGIPSCRRPDGLRRLLASVEALTGLDGKQVEVFVADNDAETCEATRVCAELQNTFRWPLSCAIVADRGISAARNAILDEARTRRVDFVAMIDDDERAAPNWLSELLKTQSRFGADIVGGPVYFQFEEEPSRSVRESGIFDTLSREEGILPVLGGTGNLLLDTVSFERARWPRFDLAFGLTGGGDTEFFVRLRNLNFRFAWSPNAAAWEAVPKYRSRRSWVLRRSYRVGNSLMRIARMHGGSTGAAISLAKAIVLLGSAPLCLPLLALPSRRLWMMRKWSQSLGKVAALVGRHYDEYSARATPIDHS